MTVPVHHASDELAAPLTARDAVELLASTGMNPDTAEQTVSYWIRSGKVVAPYSTRILSDGTERVRDLLARELLPYADRLRRHWARQERLAAAADALVGPLDTP